MCPLSSTTFPDWQSQQQADPEFSAAAGSLEISYQVAHLHIRRGLTQAELAGMAGTRQPTIARLENGTSIPCLPILNRIARALDARIELKIIPRS